MSSILGEIGLSEQLVLSYIIGTAGAPAVRPFVQSLVADAWRTHPDLPVNAELAALGVAQGQIDPAVAKEWAQEQGLGAVQFQAMVDAANVGPSLGLAYQAWRRGQLSDGQFQTALKRTGLEPQWFAALEDLKHERLDLGAIATAVHRGIMADSGLLVTPVPGGSGNVPRIPVSSLDTLAEFAAHGVDAERARVLVADTGLPLALGEMLQLYNRGQVTATDVKVSIAESNVRNEYMDVALNLARRLLTPHEYAEAELRGVVQDGSGGAALSGLNGADYQILFGLLGRPLNVHEVTTGEARGGAFNAGATNYNAVPAGPFRDAIRRSNIRPEYADLAYANRYTYPSAFVLRSLAQAGDLGGQPAVAKVLEEIGWKPSFATQVSTAWVGTTSDPHVTKAETQLWTTTHRSYVAAEINDATATAALQTAGVAAGSIPAVLTLWAEERSLIRKQLSPAQIKKAWHEQVVNPATGAPWTQAQAIAELEARGYDAADAQTLLEI